MREDFVLGDWLVQPQRYRLVRDRVEVRLTERTLRALMRLVEASGALVERQDLFEAIWPDTLVSEDSLFRTIADLRQALGDDARNPDYIVTVRQSGYRLIAPVHPREPRGDGQAAHHAAARPALEVDTAPAAVRVSTFWKVSTLLGVGLGILLVLSAGAWLTKGHLGPEQMPVALRTWPVTSDPALESEPALAPDGALVAFVRASSISEAEIFVQGLDGATPIQLTDQPGYEAHPAWSPDGNTIAFARYVDQDVTVHTVPLEGGSERAWLTLPCTDCELCGLSWHPAGDQLTFALRAPDAPSALVTLDLATQTLTTHTEPPAPLFGDRLPAWHPDGERLAFVRGQKLADHSTGLRPVEGQVMLLHGEHLEAVTADTWEVLGLAWEDESNLIATGRRAPGEPSGVWRIPLDGTSPTPLHVPETRLFRNVSSAQGHLVFEAWQATVDLWEVVMDGSREPRSLVSSTHFDHGGQYSPDGAHIAFVSSRSGFAELWRARADGTNPTRLTSFGRGHVRGATWAATSEALAFVHTTANRATLYLMAADGTNLHAVWEAIPPLAAPSFTHDGQALLVGAERDGTWDLWRVPLDGAEPYALGLAGGHVAVEQPNGEVLVTLQGQDGLFRWKLGSALPPVRLHDFPYAFDWASWALTASGIVVLGRDALGGVSLDRLDLEGQLQERVPLGSLHVPQGSLSLGVNREGTAVLVAVRTGTTSDVVSLRLP